MALDDFKQLLKETIGLDVESIGTSALERAVHARQAACQLTDLRAYLEVVTSSIDEQQRLVEEVVVPETWFFRDCGAFEALARTVQQEWGRQRPNGVVRILSVPCSSGEEPYSIAMALTDAGVSADRYEIDAVDVSLRVLATARRGVYGRNSFRAGDQSFRDRHFVDCHEGYRVADDLRRSVTFKQGNLLASGFLGDSAPYDVIFCRNLLIYFDRPTQNRAIGVLAGLLASDGLLFVGSSETGALMNHDFVSTRLTMAFAFRRRAPGAERRRLPVLVPASRPSRSRPPAFTPVVDAAVPPAPPKPATIRAREERRASTGTPPRDAIDEANRLADQGHFAEAAACCEAHVRQHGPSARAFYLLGVVRDASGSGADAESLYRKALYLDPEHREALVHLALLMDRHGRPADAQVLRNRVRRLERASDAR